MVLEDLRLRLHRLLVRRVLVCAQFGDPAASQGLDPTVLAASRVVDPAEVRQFFRIIEVQADRMDALISDLLDAGHIDPGTLSVAPQPAEAAALLGGPSKRTPY